jgi:hypothetical protein
MSDQSTVTARLNGADLEFYDKATGNIILAFRNSLGSQVIFSAQDQMSGAGSGSRTNATTVLCHINRFTTVNSNSGAVLPASGAGIEITISNAAPTNSLQIYAAGTDTIDGTAGATGYALAAGKTCTFFCASPGAWHKQLSA